MASFVESAILRCVDEASGPINKVNGSLEKLFTTAGRGKNISLNVTTKANSVDSLLAKFRLLELHAKRPLNVNVTGNLSGATSQANRFASAMERVAAAAQAASRVRMPTVPPVPPGGGSGRGRVDHGYFGRFPENIPGIAARYAGYRTVQYMHDAVRSAGRGVLAGNDQRAIDRLQRLTAGTVDKMPDGSIVDRGAMGAENWSMAARTSRQYQTMSTADAVELIRQARPQVDPTKANELWRIPEAAAKLQTIATSVFGDAKKGQDTAYKVMRAAIAAGRIDDPAKFSSMTEEVGKALIQSGKDASPTLIESMFRNAGALAKYGVGGKMIGDLVNLTDEERGRAADRIRSFTESLMRPDKKPEMRAKMEGTGLREEGGGAVDRALLARDAFEWVQKNLAPKVAADLATRKMTMPGVDDTEEARALKVGEIRNLLASKYGFTGPESQYALMAITKADEIRRERAERDRYDTSAKNIRTLQYGHFRTGLAAIEKQWENFADAFAKAHESKIAPALGSIGNLANFASRNPTTAAGVLAGGAATAAYLAHQAVTQHPGLTMAAAAHVAAAGALTKAAAALGAGGLTGALTPAQRAAAMSKAATLFGPGVVGASRAPGFAARAGASWGSMGLLGKLLTAGSIGGGALGILGGDWLGGAGTIAMTAGLMAGGPVGMTIAALGGLVAAWPILKALLGASKADAAEVKKGASDATDASKDATDAMRKHVDEMQREQAARDDARNAARQALRRPMEQFGPPPPDQVSPLLDKIDAQIRLWIEKINNLGKHKLEAAEVKEDQAASDRRQNPRREGESEAGYRRRLALEDMARVAAEREHNDWLRQNGVTPPRDRNESDADGITAGQRADQAARENANKRLDAMINGWGFNTPPAQPKEPPAFWDWFQNQQMTPQVPGGGLLEWLKGLNPFGGKPDQMGQAQGGEDMRAAFSDGASQVSAAGQAAGAAISGGAQSLVGAGQAASAGWYGQLVAAGSALGAAAAAQISAAHVNVQVNASGGGPNVGNNTGVTKPSAQ